jgi:hypothetical protein
MVLQSMECVLPDCCVLYPYWWIVLT